MSSLSKQVANRAQTADHVKKSAEVNADAIAREVARRVPGLNKSDVTRVIDAVVALLDTTNESMRTVEHAYTAEQSDDLEHRDDRDTHAQALAAQIAIVRDIAGAALGPRAVRRYGMRGTLPPSPTDLADVASNIVELLRAHPAGGPRTVGITVDTDALADSIEVHLDKLRAALDAVGREERELDLTRTARDAAVEQWSQVYPGVGALLEGFYRLAGRADLAARIRPTRHRTEGRETVEPDVDPPVDEDAPVTEPVDADVAEPTTV